VREAPGIPTILVAHLGSAPKPYVYVGRPMKGIPGSPLGNPYRPERPGPAGNAIESFRGWLRAAYGAVSAGRAAHEQREAVTELQRLAELYRETGRLTLACWCANGPCHADVIAEAIVGLVAREPVEITIPGVGEARAWYDRECPELPWLVIADGREIRRCLSLTQARQPLARRIVPLSSHDLEAMGMGKCDGCGEVKPGIAHKGICAECHHHSESQRAA
jgi:hypothetical protein